jgi:hypothetical protein
MEWEARAAHESREGQFVLLDGVARMALNETTVTIANSSGDSLLHMPLQTTLFGASQDKVMLMPTNRSPAWVLQMKPHDVMAAREALLSIGIEVADPPLDDHPQAPVNAPPLLTDEDLERVVSTPGFAEFHAEVQEALALREVSGLPDLLFGSY